MASTITAVAELALGLPVDQRGELAARLLESLPPFLADDDKGVVEALRRDADFKANPGFGMSLDEFRLKMGARRD